MEQLKRTSTANFTTYKYTQLSEGNCFRLAHILPGNYTDTIECTLSTHPLSPSPSPSPSPSAPFEALSYAWGPPEITTTIQLDGRAFSVTTGLHTALRRLRCADRERTVWIDQLCISQSDDAEKAVQVGHMGLIYEAAQRVVVWLGDEVESPEFDSELGAGGMTVEQAEADPRNRARVSRRRKNDAVLVGKVLEGGEMSDWERICAALDMLRDVAGGKHAGQVPYIRWGEASEDWELAKAVSDGMKLLLKRRWWNRIWVVQETVLPRDVLVVIGSQVVPWIVLGDAARNWVQHCQSCCRLSFGSIPQDQQRPFVRFASIMQGIFLARTLRAQKQLGIERAVEMFRCRAATDDRDKVYGLLGLLPSDSYADCDIQPDYTSPTIEVYARLVKNCIDSLYALHMLVDITSGRPDFPSWVPDLAAFETVGDVEARSSLYEFYRAWNWYTNARVHDNRVMSVSGIRVDRIAVVGEQLTMHNGWGRTGAMIQSWHDLMVTHGVADEPYVTGGTREEAFIRTVTGELIATNNLVIQHRQLAASWLSRSFWSGVWSLVKGSISSLLCWTSDPDPLEFETRRSGPEDWGLFSRWLARIKAVQPNRCDHGDPATDPSFGFTLTIPNTCDERRFYMTESGYMGVGSPNAQPGDEVFVLKGSFVPFVLRRRDAVAAAGFTRADGSNSFLLVGDCYLQGVMDGEAVQKWPERKQCVWLL